MYEYKAIITSVYDGDTCRADIDLGWGIWIHNTALRLNGLNAIELHDEGGEAAHQALLGMMPIGTPVVVRTQKDKTEKYGRMLADIWVDGTDTVNQRMIKMGFAKPWDGKGPRPV